MRIEELSVGDWVASSYEDSNGDTVCKVEGIEKWRNGYVLIVKRKDGNVDTLGIRCFEPIPITAEILEKNGFEKTAIYTTYLYNSDIEITLYGDGWWRTIGLDEYSLYRFDGVHQLQHALRLAGVEKEIEL